MIRVQPGGALVMDHLRASGFSDKLAVVPARTHTDLVAREVSILDFIPGNQQIGDPALNQEARDIRRRQRLAQHRGAVSCRHALLAGDADGTKAEFISPLLRIADFNVIGAGERQTDKVAAGHPVGQPVSDCGLHLIP